MSNEQVNTSNLSPKRFDRTVAIIARLTEENATRVPCAYCSLPVLDMPRHVELCHEDGMTELHPYLAMLARPKPSPEPDSMPTATHGFIFIDGVKISRMMQDHLIKLLAAPHFIEKQSQGQSQINNALLVRGLVDHTEGKQTLTALGGKFADIIAKLRGL